MFYQYLVLPDRALKDREYLTPSNAEAPFAKAFPLVPDVFEGE